MKRVVSAILVLVMVLTLLPVLTMEAKAEETDVYTLVEQQIRAYADSIDQPDAVDTAASALAVHGITMGGKTLKQDESNALTAVLMNSEMLQYTLIGGCATALQSMQQLDLESLPYISGHCRWSGSTSGHWLYAMTSEDYVHENRDWSLCSSSPYSGERNSYDNALDWMAGSTDVHLKVEQVKITAEEVTYTVECTVADRFDFSTSGNDGFKNLISGIGALLFREFDWEASVTFELTVPYSCTHSSGMYRWIYDAESRVLTSDGSGEYTENRATRHSHTDASGDTVYYYELDETVRLYHDKSWVVEYDVKRPRTFVFAPLENYSASTKPTLLHALGYPLSLYVTDHVTISDEAMEEIGAKDTRVLARDYYGASWYKLFPYSAQATYTFRLENKMNADGSNMIYLTVISTVTGNVLLEQTPMDDYYRNETWLDNYGLISESDNWVSGKDLLINFIGNKAYHFTADYFELRIWEDGIDGATESYVETTVVEPTCTAKGYTTHTCSKCGYSYKTDYVEKLPHDYRDEVIVPTCTAEGYTAHICKTCGYSYNTDVVPMVPHSYDNYVSNNDATCAHDGTQTGKCTVCGATDTVADEGTALPHTWTDATCTKAQTCTVCGGTEGDPLGHDLKYYNAKAPTCTDVGWDAYEKCQRCRHSTFATMPALGHNYVNGVCQNCGDGDVLLGDLNGDGEVDIFDANLIVAYYNGTADLTAAQQKAADVNGDGEIDIFDANLIVSFYNGTIAAFPVA